MDAEQYIPFPLDEVSLDFEVLPDRLANPNRVNVLLVATRTENVDTRVEVLELAGLVAKVADVESYAMERALAYLPILCQWAQIPLVFGYWSYHDDLVCYAERQDYLYS